MKEFSLLEDFLPTWKTWSAFLKKATLENSPHLLWLNFLKDLHAASHFAEPGLSLPVDTHILWLFWL